MFDRIETLRMASSLTSHASQRQKLIAQNVANADTPGFRATDLGRFAETYRSGVAAEMRATRPGHATGISWGGSDRPQDAGTERAPNGNTVSIEEEMIRIAQAKREFDLSLAVTKSSLNMIRTSIGRRG
ncbi:FlgB family protein [Paracoccus laeviglucosivorans]|uniref:Flagellar basal body rod protein FlgB n=1 Tax=Paracoccus laeviglucosivorans TaxID=1197861 RepID=A0A521DC15_9RHOB|nr:FlgB family protein [Paracoccus laeviglucosivorans]SMO69334.1 flagellar basal-body rod protein FlgB [Paracoccus laeviglucosivorans]